MVHIIDSQSKWHLLLSLSTVQEQGKTYVGNYSGKILREIPSKKNGGRNNVKKLSEVKQWHKILVTCQTTEILSEDQKLMINKTFKVFLFLT